MKRVWEFVKGLAVGRECASDAVKKSLVTLFATLMFGIAMACMFTANIGADPITMTIQALARLTGLSEGMITNLHSALTLIVLLIIGRQHIYMATIITTLFMGTGVDIGMALLGAFWPVDASFAMNLILCTVGVMILGVFIGFYIALSYGGSAVDAIKLVISNKTGLSFNTSQYILYTTYFLIGWACGGVVGIGTILGLVVTGFFVAPAIKYFNPRWTSILKLKTPVAPVK